MILGVNIKALSMKWHSITNWPTNARPPQVTKHLITSKYYSALKAVVPYWSSDQYNREVTNVLSPYWNRQDTAVKEMIFFLNWSCVWKLKHRIKEKSQSHLFVMMADTIIALPITMTTLQGKDRHQRIILQAKNFRMQLLVLYCTCMENSLTLKNGKIMLHVWSNQTLVVCYFFIFLM